jgi:3-deoxy-D-manno-octulosonic-acid transferase
LIVFVKYEFWFNFLYTIRLRNIPTILISARFRPGQVFFQWYGGWFRQQLRAFQFIFMQDNAHRALLDQYQLPYEIVGDTRVDRVAALATEQRILPKIDAFCAGAPVLVAGSTWLPDEQLLATLVEQKAFSGWKLILAPHDIQAKHLEEIERIFPTSVRYSTLTESQAATSNIMIIDNIGMLSGLYAHAKIAWIGGAFGSGLHNTLEPITFGCPVLFGPRYEKFVEAVALIQSGGAQTVSNTTELLGAWEKWQDPAALEEASRAARAYIHQNQGATQRILQWLERNWT